MYTKIKNQDNKQLGQLIKKRKKKELCTFLDSCFRTLVPH